MPQPRIIETDDRQALLEHQREREAEAKARYGVQLKEQQQAEAQRIQARRDAAAEAAIAQFKAQARGAFVGTEAQFVAAWPRLLQDWQAEAVRRNYDVERERLLATGNYNPL